MRVSEFVDLAEFHDCVTGGYIRVQHHPEFSLVVANYTEKAVFDGFWNSATRESRGLIFDPSSGDLYARPFPKFFNHSESNAPKIGPSEPVWVHDKIDGSLGIIYQRPDGEFAVATRGSFTSDQALHATEVLNTKYSRWVEYMKHFRIDSTYLVEIVYPENRIVLDYRGLDDLVLLGARDFSGQYHPPGYLTWDGPRAEAFDFDTYAAVFSVPPRENAEGFVVYVPDRNNWVKLKQDDYVELHRVVTNLSARRVYESLRSGMTAEQVCVSLPDEFHWFVREVAEYLGNRFDRILFEANAVYSRICNTLEAPEDGYRKEFAMLVNQQDRVNKSLLFKLLDGKDIEDDIWKLVEPAGDWVPSNHGYYVNI